MSTVARKVLFCVCGIMALSSCAHQKSAEKELDQKLAQENTVTTHELRKEGAKAIETAPNLTAEQKRKLMDLRAQVARENDRLVKESVKLRSLLVQDMMAEKYDVAEVDLIKRRLRKNENQRLSLAFDSIEQANQILGRVRPENRFVIQRIMDLDVNRPTEIE